MKKMKNIISVLLIVVMLLSAFSIFPTAQATDNSFKYGDVNEDSSINSYDAFTVLRHSVDIIMLNSEAVKRADVNADGQVNSTDALQILQYAVGLLDIFDAEKNDPPTIRTTLFEDVVAGTLRSGDFTLNMKYKPASLSSEDTPVVIVGNGNKTALKMTINGEMFRIIIDGDKYFIVLHTAKMYFEISPDDIVGSIGGLLAFINLDGTYVGSTKIKINGNDGICEEYKYSDGNVIKYYFNSEKEWKCMEVITEDEVAIYGITSFSNKADESVFSLKGYEDMSDLLY